MVSDIGEMPEWLNGRLWKGRMLETVSRVRIPFSPPVLTYMYINDKKVSD